MNNLEATYNGEIIFIHYVSEHIEYCLVSYSKDESKRFKLSLVDIKGVSEKQLLELKAKQDIKR